MHNTNFKIKFIYLLSLIVVSAIPLNSQAQYINYGIKGGLNVAKTSLKNVYEDIQSKTGFNLYIFGDYNFTDNISFSTEAGYTQKGFKYVAPNKTLGTETYSGTLNASLNYIDITVSAKFRLLKGNVIPYFKIGPSLGIKVSYGSSTEGNTFDESFNADIDWFLKNIYKNSFGLKSGAGVAIGINKKTSVIFEINYNFDLIDIFEPPDWRFGINSWYYSEDVKNNVLEMSAGVEF